jgi:hypothetical protein
MKNLSVVAVWLCVSGLGFAQSVVGLNSGPVTSNQDLVAQRRAQRTSSPQLAPAAASPTPRVVVFTGDRVIPQFVDGDTWQTAITVVNLENHATSFDVLFFDDNGFNLDVPVSGLGVVHGVTISLQTAGTFTFQTTGSTFNLAADWALLSQSNSDSVGIFAIFRQTVAGRQAQEAVVPSVNQFDSHFVLPFDNTFYTTGVALANPTSSRVSIPVNIRNEEGQIIDTHQFSLGAYSHSSFVLTDAWSSTAGRRGTLEFLTSGFGVGALGLRFNGGAFTSFNVLENIAWK